jgi:polyisoprenoid-binding protein YceI
MVETNQVSGSARLLSEAAGSWKLDPEGTTVELHTKAMWGLAKVKGTMKAVEGSGIVAVDGGVSGTLVVDAESIATNNKKRDQHLRSDDFFDVAKYPTLTYSATGVTPVADGQLKVTGSLTVHGQTRPLDLLASAVEGPPGRVTITGEAEIDRSQWGMTWAKMGAKLNNRVVVKAQFVKD